MTTEEIQFWTTIGGFVTTLLAVMVTWLLTSINERRRVRLEDQRRWHDERYRLLTEYQAIASRINLLLDDGLASERFVKHNQGRPVDAAVTKAAERVAEVGEEVGAEIALAYRILANLQLVMGGPTVDWAGLMLDGFEKAQRGLERLDPDEAEAALTQAQQSWAEMTADARFALSRG